MSDDDTTNFKRYDTCYIGHLYYALVDLTPSSANRPTPRAVSKSKSNKAPKTEVVYAICIDQNVYDVDCLVCL